MLWMWKEFWPQLSSHKTSENTLQEKTYRCSECWKTFSQSSTLVIHQRTHTERNLINVLTVKKCFSQSFNLIRHRRTHMGENPTNVLTVRNASAEVPTSIRSENSCRKIFESPEMEDFPHEWTWKNYSGEIALIPSFTIPSSSPSWVLNLFLFLFLSKITIKMFSDHTVAKFIWFVCQNMWEKSTSQLKVWEDLDVIRSPDLPSERYCQWWREIRILFIYVR